MMQPIFAGVSFSFRINGDRATTNTGAK
jgi:hypothetical protein